MPTIHVSREVEEFLDEHRDETDSYSQVLNRLLPIGEDVAVTVDRVRDVVRDEVRPEALQ